VFRPDILGPIYDMDLRVTEVDGKPLVLHHR
jgi:ABC-type enterochelin transport system ATPase subunit